VVNVVNLLCMLYRVLYGCHVLLLLDSGCSSSVVLFYSDDNPAGSKHVVNVHNK
jgi:hypothetical protein